MQLGYFLSSQGYFRVKFYPTFLTMKDKNDLQVDQKPLPRLNNMSKKIQGIEKKNWSQNCGLLQIAVVVKSASSTRVN